MPLHITTNHLTISGATTGQVLGWNGSKFVPTTLTDSGDTTSVAWIDITDKPTEFTPAAHTHTFSSLTEKPTTISGYGIVDSLVKSVNGALPDANGNVTINTGTGSTSGDYLALTGGTVSGKLSVGNSAISTRNTRALNLVGTDAVMRVYRIGTAGSADVGIEMIQAATGTPDVKQSYWDQFLNGSTDTLNFRQRTMGGSGVVKLTLGETISTFKTPLTTEGTIVAKGQNATDAVLIAKGASGHTGNLSEWQTVTGSILSRVDKDGNIYAPGFRNMDGTAYSTGSGGTTGSTGATADTLVQRTADASIYASNGYFTGNVQSMSSKKVKTDIRPYIGGLDKVLQMKPSIYNRTDIESDNEVGFISEEVELIEPSVVRPNGEYLTLDYGKLTTMLVASVQEQQKLIEVLIGEVEELKKNLS